MWWICHIVYCVLFGILNDRHSPETSNCNRLQGVKVNNKTEC